MIYRMKLQDEPFKQIKNGTKKIEIRLNDEKRKLLKTSDYIEFTNIKTLEILFVQITNLYHFDSFKKLFENFDNKILGGGSYEKMYDYYSKKDEIKYGIIGIEINNILNVKQIIHNEDNLTLMDVNKVTRRAKLIVENNKGEILLCQMGTNYFLIGGHVDNDESDEECLLREVYEEAGVKLDFSNILPIACSNYINKDYPEKGTNTYTNSNYYYLKYDLIFNIKNQHLTNEELKENFKLMYVSKNKIIDFLNDKLLTCQRKGTLIDTIMAINVYLNLQK